MHVLTVIKPPAVNDQHPATWIEIIHLVVTLQTPHQTAHNFTTQRLFQFENLMIILPNVSSQF